MAFFNRNRTAGDSPNESSGKSKPPITPLNEKLFWFLSNNEWRQITEDEFLAYEIQYGFNDVGAIKRRTDGFHKGEIMGRILWYEPYAEHFKSDHEKNFREA